MSKNVKKTVIFFIVGLFILLAVLYLVGISEIINELLLMNLRYYMIAVGFIIVSIYFWAMRWKIFLKSNNDKISSFNLMKILLVGLAINNITPIAKLGGEPVRAYLLKKKYDINMRDGFASILAELTVFFIVTFLIIIVALFLLPFTISPPLWIWALTILFGIITLSGFLGIIGVYSNQDFIVKIIKWLGNKIKALRPYQETMLERYMDFQKKFRSSLKDKRLFSTALLVTILAKLSNILKYYFIFLALGHPISFIQIIIVIGIGSILLTLPSTPGSLGILEGGLIPVFMILGVPAEIAATGIFLERLVWFWGVTGVGGVIGAYYGISLLETEKFNKLADKIKR